MVGTNVNIRDEFRGMIFGLATQLISIVNPSIFRIRCNSIKL